MIRAALYILLAAIRDAGIAHLAAGYQRSWCTRS
jgi:hypothetical protein